MGSRCFQVLSFQVLLFYLIFLGRGYVLLDGDNDYSIS